MQSGCHFRAEPLTKFIIMKRLFNFILVIFSFVTLDSCEKHNGLIGTIWTSEPSPFEELLYGGNTVMAYEFIDDEYVEDYVMTNSGRIKDMNGTWKYEYNHPYINIHYKMSDGSEILMEYELVNDRTMERINAAIGETYIRQN